MQSMWAQRGTGAARYLAPEDIVKAGAMLAGSRAHPGRRGRARPTAWRAHVGERNYFRGAMSFDGCTSTSRSAPGCSCAEANSEGSRDKDPASQVFSSLFSLTTNTALPYTSCNIIASPCEAGL